MRHNCLIEKKRIFFSVGHLEKEKVLSFINKFFYR